LPLSSASLDRLTDIFLHASQRFGPGQQAQYTSLDCGTGGLHPVPPSRRKWATPPYLRETSAFNYVSVPVRRPPPMHCPGLSHARRASSPDPFYWEEGRTPLNLGASKVAGLPRVARVAVVHQGTLCWRNLFVGQVKEEMVLL
jgi:hypothetical protein